ncbi:hypothetical protein CROQUDRAFT_674100 [Cronartium quercuum f. sp. fusiforme G11]|uniref:Diphthamide biosynthesis protein 3 n=1 Tax=Cronartium quercuum f. sp. fusiforme G11 TaxID=708437 RepID=A0A9P6N9G6_9BASI|nr:hypothetical protein CROQUDRAFT_674100 [Cronartium quercuum f. sp. fusiforme G11]
MVSYYDEIEIEDFIWDPISKVYHTPCPCGDRFEISKLQLSKGDDIATCPSCSLIIKVIYDFLDYEDYSESEGEEEEGEEKEVVESLTDLKI